MFCHLDITAQIIPDSALRHKRQRQAQTQLAANVYQDLSTLHIHCIWLRLAQDLTGQRRLIAAVRTQLGLLSLASMRE